MLNLMGVHLSWLSVPAIIHRITPGPPPDREIRDQTNGSIALKSTPETNDKALARVFIAAQELPVTVMIVAYQKYRVLFPEHSLIRERHRVSWCIKRPISWRELVRMVRDCFHEV